MDIDRIKGGENFVKAIESVLELTGAMLVVIGKDWLTVNDETGRRRLDDPRDLVRLEIATALSNNLLLIPVLVQGARMPTEEALPPELKELVHMNAVLASDERWGPDIKRLAKILELDVPGSLNERRFNKLKRLILALIFTCVVATVITSFVTKGVGSSPWSLFWWLNFLDIILMLGVSILLPMIAGLAEDSSRTFMRISLACGPLSAFMIAVGQPEMSIISNTALLVLLNISTFSPR